MPIVNKLKPCPLCGGESVWCGEHDPQELHFCHHILCTKCSSQYICENDKVDDYETVEKAREVAQTMYNKRSNGVH